MPTKIAINGFGRIGRNAFKQAFEMPDEIEIVAINDLTTIDNIAYLLRWDSVYGPFKYNVETSTEGEKSYLVVDGKKFLYLSEKDPTQLPWGDLGIDVVVESTGVFTTTEKAQAHLDGGAKRVVISAPAKDEETPSKLAGTNASDFNEDLAKITSNASCTTNAVVPLTAILMGNPGFSKSMMTTVHGYTATQAIVDGPNPKDHLRGRAAALNIVPSHTGAAIASAKSNPTLKDKFDAVALRVPVPAGSIVDFVFLANKKTTVEEVNDILRNAAKEDHWKGIFTVTEEPLVSTDILGNPHASIADLTFTRVVDGDLVKVMAWYDNEWGYTHALLKHVIEVGKLV